MKLPIGIHALGLTLAGVLATQHLAPPRAWGPGLLFAAGCLALPARRGSGALLPALALLLLSAATALVASGEPRTPGPQEVPHGLLRIHGRVLESARRGPDGEGLSFAFESDSGEAYTVVLRAAHPVPLRGEAWEVTGRVLQHRPLCNFDCERRAEERRILLSAPPGLVRDGGPPSLSARLEALRARVHERLLGVFAPRWQPFASALLLGRGADLDPETRRVLRDTGSSHLLAVSGLHLGLFLLFPIWASRRWHTRSRGFSLLVLILVYGLLTGARTPIRRAMMLWSAFVASELLNRPHGSWNALGWAASLELLWDPSQIHSISFLLSYAAVASILSVAHLRSDRETLRWPRATIARALRVGTAATLATLPILHAHFGAFSAHSIWITPIAAAGLALSMIPGYLALLLGSSLLAAPAELLFWAVTSLLRLADELPGTPTLLAGLPLALTSLLALAGLLLLWRRRRLALAALLAAAAVPVGIHLANRGSGEADPDFFVEVLDVGHGSCVLLGAAGGPFALFDAGSASAPRDAARALEQRLALHGIEELELLVHSHADADHRNLPCRIPCFPRVRTTLGSASCPPEGLRLSSGALAYQLGPAQLEIRAAALPPTAARNERSLLVILRLPGQVVLLFGDHESAGLCELIESLPRCDHLLWPHHGRARWGAQMLLEHVRPRTVWVSDASAHGFGGAGVEILSTARCGALRWCWKRDGSTWIETAAGTPRRYFGRRSCTTSPFGTTRAAGRSPSGAPKR